MNQTTTNITNAKTTATAATQMLGIDNIIRKPNNAMAWDITLNFAKPKLIPNASPFRLKGAQNQTSNSNT